jgi:DNA-binding transcriptional MerR regulator
MKREKLFKIGEVMEYSGLSRQTIHNYTLANLIYEARRTPSGHRLYDESVFDRLEKIKILQTKNYTLMQIKRILEQEGSVKQS